MERNIEKIEKREGEEPTKEELERELYGVMWALSGDAHDIHMGLEEMRGSAEAKMNASDAKFCLEDIKSDMSSLQENFARAEELIKKLGEK